MVNGFTDTQSIDASLAAFGLKQERQVEEHLDIWPENLAAFNLFYRLRSQWAVGPAAVVGLNYSGFAFWLQTDGVPQTDWPEVADAVQVLEFETLRLWREKR